MFPNYSSRMRQSNSNKTFTCVGLFCLNKYHLWLAEIQFHDIFISSPNSIYQCCNSRKEDKVRLKWNNLILTSVEYTGHWPISTGTYYDIIILVVTCIIFICLRAIWWSKTTFQLTCEYHDSSMIGKLLYGLNSKWLKTHLFYAFRNR